MSFFAWLGRLVLRTLSFVGLDLRDDFVSRSLEDRSVSVVVRANDGRAISLFLDRKWTIADVR